jgi:YgiT-type zinc finger domain-containing protein
MNCPLCKGRMELGTTILPFDMKKGKVIVIMNVPALICEQCGDEFIDFQVAKNVEMILSRVQQEGLSMGFVEYGVAA